MGPNGTPLPSHNQFAPPVDLSAGELPYERMWAGAKWEWIQDNPLRVDAQ